MDTFDTIQITHVVWQQQHSLGAWCIRRWVLREAKTMSWRGLLGFTCVRIDLFRAEDDMGGLVQAVFWEYT